MADQYAAVQVSEAVLAVIGQQYGESITRPHLQQFMYAAQGYNLATKGCPLFLEPIEACPYGPVVRTVERCYYKYELSRICDYLENDADDPEELNWPCIEELPFDLLNPAAWACEVYGSISSSAFRALIENSYPWQAARFGISANSLGRRAVDLRHLREYFREVLDSNPRRSGFNPPEWVADECSDFW